jgi:hypothetical protein
VKTPFIRPEHGPHAGRRRALLQAGSHHIIAAV